MTEETKKQILLHLPYLFFVYIYGSAGFEIDYSGDDLIDNDWVRVVGTLDMVPREGTDYFRLVLRVMQIQKLEVRGSEFVLQ